MASTTRHPCSICFDTSKIDYQKEEMKDVHRKKYVYLDKQNVLHYSLDCEILNPIIEHSKEEYAINFIEINEMHTLPNWYCARCFTDGRFEEILSRINILPINVNSFDE